MRWLGRPRHRCHHPSVLLIALAGVAALLAGCGQGEGTAAGSSGKLQVVAAENFWGSIAAQLGGDRVQVRSIIVNPATDPHSYEPTAEDARTMAGARLAIVNGVGYDEWASKLLAASPLSGRVTLNVGQLFGLQDGDNPHRWYFPADVYAVVGQIVHDYERLRPARRATSNSAGTPSKRRASPATTSCGAKSANATPARRWATARAYFRAWAKTWA